MPAPAMNPKENRKRPLYIFNSPTSTTDPMTMYCVGISDERLNRLAGGELSAGWTIVFGSRSERHVQQRLRGCISGEERRMFIFLKHKKKEEGV